MISLVTGKVLVNVTYNLTEENAIQITMKASATKPTPINLANHCYFNLGTYLRTKVG